MASLEDFATAERQEQRKHPKCITCNLPTQILSQVEEGREEGYTYILITNWLRSGLEDATYDIPPTTLANHFKFGHHLGK